MVCRNEVYLLMYEKGSSYSESGFRRIPQET